MTGIISYKLQFIDSARFMASSLSNLVGNLAERIVNVRTVIVRIVTCCLEYKNAKDDLIEYNCLCCNKS